MNEENINNEPVEVEVEPTQAETNETPATEIEAKPERPWNKKEPDPIPYHRFQEVNSKYREIENRYNEIQSKYAELEAKVNGPKMPEIKDIDEIRPEQFTDSDGNIDNYAWLKAREAYLQQATFRQFEERQRQAEFKRRAQEIEDNLSNKFDERKAESIKYDPEVKEAVEWFTKEYATKLSPQVRYAIVTDENGPDLIKHLCTDGSHIMEMLSKRDEIGAIREMAKWSAKFTRNTPTTTEDDEIDEKPAFMVNKKPTIPTVKGSRAPAKKVEDMSPAEYRKWRTGK